MAYISYKPAQGTSVSLTAGSPDNPPVYVPDNCHTLIIYNPNADDALVQWVGWPAAFDPTTAVRIPAGSSLTLAIGAASARVKDSGLLAGNYYAEIPYYDLVSGTGDLFITYVNSPQS